MAEPYNRKSASVAKNDAAQGGLPPRHDTTLPRLPGLPNDYAQNEASPSRYPDLVQDEPRPFMENQYLVPEPRRSRPDEDYSQSNIGYGSQLKGSSNLGMPSNFNAHQLGSSLYASKLFDSGPGHEIEPELEYSGSSRSRKRQRTKSPEAHYTSNFLHPSAKNPGQSGTFPSRLGPRETGPKLNPTAAFSTPLVRPNKQNHGTHTAAIQDQLGTALGMKELKLHASLMPASTATIVGNVCKYAHPDGSIPSEEKIIALSTLTDVPSQVISAWARVYQGSRTVAKADSGRTRNKGLPQSGSKQRNDALGPSVPSDSPTALEPDYFQTYQPLSHPSPYMPSSRPQSATLDPKQEPFRKGDFPCPGISGITTDDSLGSVDAFANWNFSQPNATTQHSPVFPEVPCQSLNGSHLIPAIRNIEPNGQVLDAQWLAAPEDLFAASSIYDAGTPQAPLPQQNQHRQNISVHTNFPIYNNNETPNTPNNASILSPVSMGGERSPVSECSEEDSAAINEEQYATSDEEDSLPIKCICGFFDDDGSTVPCKTCNKWQHLTCYYDTSDVPDNHECVDCSPRQVDSERAAVRQRQLRNLPKSEESTPLPANRHSDPSQRQSIALVSERTINVPGVVVPSDSGYQSGLGTDTASVCSEESVGSSLGLSQDFLQDFVAFFGDVLIERAGARNWAEHALAQHPSEVIEKRLNSLLKDYAMELLETKDTVVKDYLKNRTPARALGTDVRIATGATKLIRRYRPKITRYFRDNITTAAISADSMSSRLQEIGKQLTLRERLALFERQSATKTDPSEGLEDNDDDADDREYEADLAPIQDFLVSGEPFQNLLTAVRRSLYYNDLSGMEQARQQVYAALAIQCTGACIRPELPLNEYPGTRQECHCNCTEARLDLVVDWSLPEFLNSQFSRRIPRLGSLITLTGSALYAQAATCSEYLQSTWPSSGGLFLDSLQDALDKRFSADSAECIHLDHTSSKLRIKFTLPPVSSKKDGTSRMEICANGIPQHLTELTQQILWIGSALNFSASSEQIAYSEAVIGQGPSCLNISFRNTALHPTENPCWLPLFSGATIARNFPIPERQDQTGLEIPIDIMAGIAGVRHAVEYAGGVVMKGFSSMFVPIERLGNLVQWHLISSSDCDTRLSYKDVLERCKNRATLKDVSLDSLRTTRAIVGWCNTASTTLGSALANYENLDYSGAKDAESSLKCAGGTLGFQQFGVAQADFSFGPKDGKCHFQRNGPYESIVKIAEKTPVTLYDTAENRAWLVPASSVILHIAQHRNWLEPFQVDGQRVNLFSSLAKCSSIRDILLRNASIELSDYERYTFKDMVTNIWSLLEFLLDQNVRIDRTAGGAIEKPCQDILKGFEFKAVVEELSPFRQKQAKIKKTCGGWPTLVRDIDALVLFANGFEDLILPLEDESADLCRLWQRVPKGQDYLATSVKTLTDLYNVAGCRTSRAYLTSTELQWHRGTSTLFEPCKNPGAYRCECVRLQRILPKSATGTIIPPGSLTEAKDGAVIFGHSSTVLQTLKPTFKVPSTKGLFTQPNIPLTPVIVGQDSDEGLTDGETVGQTDSDGTGITPSSSITSYTNEDESSNQDVSMTGLELEPRGSRKRRWPPDESGDSLMAPQRKCQFLEPNKRTKNTTPSREMNPGCRVFGGSQKSPEPSTLGPGNETYSCQFGDPTCLKSPPQLRVLKKQTAQTFDRRYTQREP